MKNFVSTQTYALRSSAGARFGFADSRIGTTPVSDVIEVEDRAAEAIRDSETSPSSLRRDRRMVRQRRRRSSFTSSGGSSADMTPPTIVANVEEQLGSNGW